MAFQPGEGDAPLHGEGPGPSSAPLAPVPASARMLLRQSWMPVARVAPADHAEISIRTPCLIRLRLPRATVAYPLTGGVDLQVRAMIRPENSNQRLYLHEDVTFHQRERK